MHTSDFMTLGAPAPHSFISLLRRHPLDSRYVPSSRLPPLTKAILPHWDNSRFIPVLTNTRSDADVFVDRSLTCMSWLGLTSCLSSR